MDVSVRMLCDGSVRQHFDIVIAVPWTSFVALGLLPSHARDIRTLMSTPRLIYDGGRVCGLPHVLYVTAGLS